MDTRTLPEKIDLAQWVAKGASFKGQMALTDFERLSLSLSAQCGPLNEDEQATFSENNLVSVEVHGEFAPQQLPMLRVQLTASVPLRCQRCLAIYPHPVSAQFLATHEGIDEDRLPRNCELGEVDEDGLFELKSLVEDELLLSIPVAPKHDHVCVTDDKMTVGQIQVGDATVNKPKGLEALVSLKKQLK